MIPAVQAELDEIIENTYIEKYEKMFFGKFERIAFQWKNHHD